MIRSSRAWCLGTLALALAMTASTFPSRASAQRVVVEPRRGRGGGGSVVVTPPRRGGGAVVTTPPPRGGAVVVQPPPRGGAVVTTPPPRGGAVVVQPPPRGGAVVVEPPRRGGAVVVTPPRTGGGVVVTPPRAGGVVVTPPRRGGSVVVSPPRPGVVVTTPRVVVRRPPPRVRVAVPPPPPRPRVWVAPAQPGEVWLDGFWHWDGGQWLWVDGHWELPPEPGAIWVAPEVAGGQWVPGYWTMPSMPGAGTLGRPYQVGAYVSGFLTYSDPADPRTGGRFHDYLVSLSAGESATFFAVAGPSERVPGQRVPLFLEVLWNGQPMASADVSTSPFDARVVFTAPRPAVYTLRVHTRGGADTGTYVLESAPGTWMPEVDPYQQFWGQPQPQAQPGWGQPQPQEWAAPPGAAVAVSVGTTVGGRLEPGDYVDETGGMYDELVLDAAPGETFTVVARCGTTLSGQSTNDVLLRIFSNGQLVGEDDDSAGGRNARLVLSAPAGGQIVIRVATWRGSMERDGSYTISILPGQQPGAQ